jgi:hypothetical protein
MEEVASQNCRGQSEERIDCRTAAPDICMVNDIVMEQGGNVQVFKSYGQGVNGITAAAAESCGKYTEQGPDSFAAIEKSMFQHLEQDWGYQSPACKVLQVTLHGLVDNADLGL